MACVDFLENVGDADGFFDYQTYRPPPTPLQPPASNACFSPRFSFSRDLAGADLVVKELRNGEKERAGDADFEFCMVLSEDPRSSNAMLSADELFFQGKLRPLQPAQRTERIVYLEEPLPVQESADGKVKSNSVASKPVQDDPYPSNVATVEDPYICTFAEDPYSCAVATPKANKSSGKWKGLLSFKKLHISTAPPPSQASPPPHKPNDAPSKSLRKLFTGADSKRFDRVTSRSESSLSRRDSNADSAPSRLSISSSSSLPNLCPDELPRRSLDSQKEDSSLRKSLRVNVDGRAQEKSHSGRIEKIQVCPKKISRRGGATTPLDSPRISASGKIVFRSLERSCSSPSSFNRHARKRGNSFRQFKGDRQGLERSYSENVRISPVLHVPVGISPSFRSVKAASKGGIFGLTHLFSSPQKKENGGKRTRNSPCPPLSSTSVEGSKIFGM